MKGPIVQSAKPVTLVAGGPVGRRDLRMCLSRAPVLVAADGGADRALAAGQMPDAVIGDLDSLSDAARERLAGRLHHVAEQDTTDFHKTLRNIDAPLVLAVGVIGARVDHELSAMNVMVGHRGAPLLAVGPEDVILAAPPKLELRMAAGDRLSLFPMAPVTGRSEGLRWPIEGIEFAPAGRVGTSNEAEGPVRLAFDAPGMLVMLPRRRIDVAIRAVLAAPRW